MPRRISRADQRAIERQRQGIGTRAFAPSSIARMFGGATKPGAPVADPTRKPKRQDRRWQKLQAEQLEREPFCRLCAAEGKGQVNAFEVDHILALADGGSFDDAANLQSLCRLHHYQKTENENARRAGRKPRKVRLRAPVDPATGMPMAGYGHWWNP